LPEGEIEHPRVLTHLLAVGRSHLALARGQVTAEELAEIALSDEADAGGVLLLRRREPGLAGDASDLLLWQVAERKPGGRQLCLSELVQEVALVLAAVDPPQEPPVAALVRHAGVVPGCDGLRAQFAGRVEEVLELDLAVAEYVRVGRTAGGVLGQEVFEHAAPVLAGEVAEMDRDAQAP